MQAEAVCKDSKSNTVLEEEAQEDKFQVTAYI